MVEEEAAVGFDRSAAAYDRGRPDYPRPAVDWLTGRAGLGPGRTVVDLAAGTGKLTRPLARTGARVVAVEPVRSMLERLVGAVPEVAVVAGTAEAIPLADHTADAVTVGQAFHWFAGPAAVAELHRVLRPEGRLALIWNRRELEDPVHREIEEIIGPHRGDTPTHRSGQWRAALDATEGFALVAEEAFPNVQELDTAGLLDRVTSTSFVAALPAAERHGVEEQLRALATRHRGAVRLPYQSEVHLFARRG